MTYSVHAFRPQIYSYQSRSRFRQYPRDVRTSIPGAGFAVSNLRWGEQAIDLSGLGVAPDNRETTARWFLVTPAVDRALQADPALYRLLGSMPSGVLYMGISLSGTTVYMKTETANRTIERPDAKFSVPAGAQVLSNDEMLHALFSYPAQRTSAPESTGRNKLPLYIGLGLGAAALLGGGYFLMKRGKKAA